MRVREIPSPFVCSTKNHTATAVYPPIDALQSFSRILTEYFHALVSALVKRVGDVFDDSQVGWVNADIS